MPLSENATLQRGRHVRDNATGLTADVSILSGSGIPLHVRYRRKGDGEYTSVQSSISRLFNFSGGTAEASSLSGKAEMLFDRGYTGSRLIHYLLSLGIDMSGTMKSNIKWFPYTPGKGKEKEQSTNDEREYISADGPPCLFQKSVTHNLGGRNNKDFNLTAAAFRNGYSSNIAMTISSSSLESTKSDETHLDVVISTPASARRYFSDLSMNSKPQFMFAFKRLVGSDPIGDSNEEIPDEHDHAEILWDQARPLTEVQCDRS